MKHSLSVVDYFHITKKFYLAGEDFISLSLLYLPLVGVDSHSLYFVLHSLDEEPKQVKYLLDCLNFENAIYLDNSLKKLEALGLLNRYYHEQKGYVFEIIKPLDIKSFLAHPLLANFLKEKIGTIELEKIVKSQKNTFKDYEKQTAAFDEVYTTTQKKKHSNLTEIFTKRLEDSIIISSNHLDYALFKLSFNESEIDLAVLEDRTFEKEIMRISFQYQLKEEEMKRAIINAITYDNDLSYKTIANQAMRIYRNRYGTSEVIFITKEPDAFVVGSENDNNSSKIISRVESMSVEETLKIITKTPAPYEIKMFDNLARNFEFPISVINVMILSSDLEKNGELPGIGYFEKIAANWKRAGIKTAGEALEYIENKSKETKTKGRKKKTETKKPDWYDDYEVMTDVTPTEEDVDIKQAIEAKKNLFDE